MKYCVVIKYWFGKLVNERPYIDVDAKTAQEKCNHFNSMSNVTAEIWLRLDRGIYRPIGTVIK